MRYSFPGLLTIAGVLLLFSCKKPTINETDIIAQDNVGLEFTDTLTLIAHTVTEDSIFSENLSVVPLGAMEDPNFGKTYAGAYTRVLLPSNNIDLGDSLVFDSLVLTLDYTGSYNDLSLAQTFKVYELGEKLSDDESYYSNTELAIKGEIGSKVNFVHNLDDEVPVGVDDTLSPHLRIRLDDTYGENLMNQSGQTAFSDNASFFDYLNGIFIMPDTTVLCEGMAYFDFSSLTLSRLRLYYHNSDTNYAELQLFLSGSSGLRVSYYKHNIAGYPVESYVTNPNPGGDSVLYVQSMAGVVGRFEVPYIQNLGNILINKAELVVTQVGDTSFPEPGSLTLVPEDGDFQGPIILDQFISNFFGGAKETELDTTGMEFTRYKFNLARQMQAIVNTDTSANTAIWVKTFPSSRIADRLIIGGTGHSTGAIKLNLTYTKID